MSTPHRSEMETPTSKVSKISKTTDFSQHLRVREEPRPKKGNCCSFLCRKREPPFEQTMVVLRHSERKDRVDPSWPTSQDSKDWPHDTPITQKGVELAKSVAEELVDVHSKANFVAIACSPYLRCIQTAAEVAKLLNLPVLIDQEMGEVRDRGFPKEARAHRSASQLKEITDALGIRVINCVQDGGFKLFGREPQWGETLEIAKQRFVVRIDEYIEQSTLTRSNFIVVTHADAVAALLVMLERGGADVQSMDFCARVIAQRRVKPSSVEENGVYAAQWSVECKAMNAAIYKDEKLAKYMEGLHLDNCVETQEMVAKRKEVRSKTDGLFDQTLQVLTTKTPSDNNKEDRGTSAKSTE